MGPSLLIFDLISLTEVSNRLILSAWRAISPAARGDISKLSIKIDESLVSRSGGSVNDLDVFCIVSPCI